MLRNPIILVCWRSVRGILVDDEVGFEVPNRVVVGRQEGPVVESVGHVRQVDGRHHGPGRVVDLRLRELRGVAVRQGQLDLDVFADGGREGP